MEQRTGRSTGFFMTKPDQRRVYGQMYMYAGVIDMEKFEEQRIDKHIIQLSVILAALSLNNKMHLSCEATEFR